MENLICTQKADEFLARHQMHDKLNQMIEDMRSRVPELDYEFDISEDPETGREVLFFNAFEIASLSDEELQNEIRTVAKHYRDYFRQRRVNFVPTVAYKGAA